MFHINFPGLPIRYNANKVGILCTTQFSKKSLPLCFIAWYNLSGSDKNLRCLSTQLAEAYNSKGFTKKFQCKYFQ